MHDHHDTLIAGHPRWYKTTELILCEFWWPSLQKDVRSYVEGCETCQCTKPLRRPAKTPLYPFLPPPCPWDTISLDIISPLPKSQGCNAILTIVDAFSKMIKCEPISMEVTSEGIARILHDNVFCLHGLPKKIIHDQDPRFLSKYAKELFKLLSITQNPSTAYHPPNWWPNRMYELIYWTIPMSLHQPSTRQLEGMVTTGWILL